MVIALAILLVIHSLIHLLGMFKAFGWAELPQLTRAITPALGVLWLAASLLFLSTAVALVAWPRWWWVIALAAVCASTIAIIPSWADAKVGAVANAIVLVAVAAGVFRNWPR